MIYLLDSGLAQQFGILEAILLVQFRYWIERNEANDRNFYDNNWWTYNSMTAFQKMFPFASEKSIRNALKHLEEEGLIVTGNYNKLQYDRTKWYALTQKGRLHTDNFTNSIRQKGQMDLPVGANGNGKKGEPIPKDIPNKNTDSKTHILSEFENLWAIYPKKQGKKQAMAAYERARNSGTTYEEVKKGIQAYKEFLKANNKGLEYVKMGSSFFNQEAWGDDWSIRYETEGDKTYGKRMGQVHNGAAPKDSRGVAGAVGRGNSGNEERIVRFPEVAYSFSEEA